MLSQTPRRLDALTVPPPQLGPNFQRDLVALIPSLRAFSRGLCRGTAIAEDLAQETLAKAWRSRDDYEAGTNLRAWLFTILRNEFYSHARRSSRETHWDPDAGERIPGAALEQEWAMHLSDARRALATLPERQQDPFILVAAGGYSYAEAAVICGTPMGTAKSRVARARAALVKILEEDERLPLHATRNHPVPMALCSKAAPTIQLDSRR